MARIRTIKPEAFVSESLAEVSLTAERTFFGLLTQVDDAGRIRDNAAILHGLIWPLRPSHTSAEVEEDLRQLEKERLICRYQGADGKRYLHLPTFGTHQKISHPTPSRLPECSSHGNPDGGPGRGSGDSPEGSGDSREESGAGRDDSGEAHEFESNAEAGAADLPGQRSASQAESASGKVPDSFGESQPRACARAGAPEVEVELGKGKGRKPARSSQPPNALPLFEAAPSARDEDPPEPVLNAGTLIAEWLEYRGDNRPSQRIIGQVSKYLKAMLAEIGYEVVREGFQLWENKGLDPIKLDSCVNEVQSKRQRAANGRQSGPVSATTQRTRTGIALMREFAAEEGVDLATVIPLTQRRGISA